MQFSAKMAMTRLNVVILTMLLGTITTMQCAVADPDDAILERGERLFSACRTCHTTEEGSPNRVGPNLFGVFGSKAGGKPDFNYSDALKNSGIIWSEQTLDEWLTKPNEFLKGTKMSFPGVKNEADRKALIVYLKQETSTQ